MTRWACEKIVQSVAQPIFVKINRYNLYRGQLLHKNSRYSWNCKKIPKKTMIQWTKIRPIWSPWSSGTRVSAYISFSSGFVYIPRYRYVIKKREPIRNPFSANFKKNKIQ
jgi:hypothetical protein